jgi:hypothetical protein
MNLSILCGDAKRLAAAFFPRFEPVFKTAPPRCVKASGIMTMVKPSGEAGHDRDARTRRSGDAPG